MGVSWGKREAPAGEVVAPAGIWLTAQGAAVPAGHQRGETLLVGPGGTLAPEQIREHGLTKDGRLPKDWEKRADAALTQQVRAGIPERHLRPGEAQVWLMADGGARIVRPEPPAEDEGA